MTRLPRPATPARRAKARPGAKPAKPSRARAPSRPTKEPAPIKLPARMLPGPVAALAPELLPPLDLAPAEATHAAPAPAYPAVIRVFATSQDPDFDGPWQARTPSSSSGSAVVIGPGLLLTGAHVVANATFLQVQKPSQPDKAIARVRAVSHDSDLALLE